MKLGLLSFLVLLLFSLSSCNSDKKPPLDTQDKKTKDVINPIPIDVKVLSGLDLKPVTNKNDPDRRLFQKRLYRGEDLSVYVVSSETATANHKSYGIDEFLYVLNGRARLNPLNGDEVFFNTGDFFLAPKGFNGEWETQGGDEFLIELSIITTRRAAEDIDQSKTLPYLVDKEKLSGIGITQIGEPSNKSYKDELYQGAELEIEILAEKPDSTYDINESMKEQLVYVISGVAKIQAEGGEEFVFHRGDFYLLPDGFRGTMKTMGHGLFRYLKVSKSRNMAN